MEEVEDCQFLQKPINACLKRSVGNLDLVDSLDLANHRKAAHNDNSSRHVD